MAQRRIREAEETGAQELVSACPFCYQGLQVGITATQSPLVMRDISFLVEASLQDERKEKPKKERKVRKARKPREPKTRKAVKEETPSADS
jgi:heterodisulfide reductase subunit D